MFVLIFAYGQKTTESIYKISLLKIKQVSVFHVFGATPGYHLGVKNESLTFDN